MKTVPPVQLSLFDSRRFPLSEMKRAMKYELNRLASESKLSREEILLRAREEAEIEGVNLSGGNGSLSQSMLDKWLNPNAKGYMPDWDAFVILCRILGDKQRAVNPFLAALDLEAMSPEDKKFCEIGRLETELKCIRKRKRLIEESI